MGTLSPTAGHTPRSFSLAILYLAHSNKTELDPAPNFVPLHELNIDTSLV